MSLKLRISLLFSALLLAAVGGLAVVLVWSESRALSDNMAHQQTEAAEALAEVGRNAIFSGQDLAVTNAIRRLAALPEVVSARCVKLDGTVMGDTDSTLIGTVQKTRWKNAVFAPIRYGSQELGLAEIVFSQDILQARLRKEMAVARRRIFKIAVPALLLGFIGAFLTTAYVVRPVRALEEATRIFGEGKLDHALPVRRNDELGRLARAFNDMAGRLKELDRMKQDFVSSVTHDLKSPLAAIRAALDMTQAAGTHLLIRQNVDRLHNLITDVLDTAHIESGLKLNRRAASLGMWPGALWSLFA
jgi:signal transduction histidine kinase